MKTGIFSIGLDTYWPQFDGLLDKLLGYHGEIRERISTMGTDIVDAGMVDSPERAREAAALFKTEDVDIIFLFISTYALSSTVLPRGPEGQGPRRAAQSATRRAARLRGIQRPR